LAEYIFLKDGSILTGKIEYETATAVSFLKNDGKRLLVEPKNILRVLYTELYMGRVYVQKIDGKGLEVFMVDEDQEYYTFRHELYKPEEIRIKRTDVLFMARKNPTGLQALKIDADRIDLTWFPPYNQIKYYKIYFKNKEDDKYTLAGDTYSKSFTIRNLKSNTRYFIIVTAVDRDNYESLPSNEIKETTKNIRPDNPGNIKINKAADKSGKNSQANISWNPANDPDGTIVKYRIYSLKINKKELIGETKDLKYIINSEILNNRIMVSSVDNIGDESSGAEAFFYSKLNAPHFEIMPGVIFPLEKFGHMNNIGFGGMISFSLQNLFFMNFEMGLTAGFYYLQGKDQQDMKNILYQDFFLIPVYLTAAYNIRFGTVFILKPVVSAGGTYIDMKFFDRNKTAAEGQNMHLQIFSFSFKAGLVSEFRISDTLSLSLGCEYGAIVQNKGLLSFIMLNAGVGFYF
jgi:fibronectin type 3 domain-containing protein